MDVSMFSRSTEYMPLIWGRDSQCATMLLGSGRKRDGVKSRRSYASHTVNMGEVAHTRAGLRPHDLKS